MKLALIAAISENNCIGKQGKLPWNIPEDMKHFKDLTLGHTVLMGRKTWESLPPKFRPLPQRKNIVITRDQAYQVPEGVVVCQSITQVLEQFSNDIVLVIGGAEIYKQTIDIADTLYITHVHKHVDGDAFFPPIDHKQWKVDSEEKHEEFSFVTYSKI